MKQLLKKLNEWTDDRTFNDRKIKNANEIILAMNQAGLNNKQISKLCKVSAPMVTRWKNKEDRDEPTQRQLSPAMEHLGIGRFKVELEPLSPAAIKYRRFVADLIGLSLLLVIFGMLYWTLWIPCSDNWEQCSQLPWYDRPMYIVLETYAKSAK